MRGFRFELLLATTALTLVVVGYGLPSFAAPDDEAEISAAVPIPEPANLPPPTAADLVPLGTEPATGATPPAQTASAPPGSSENPPAIRAPATTPAAAEAPPAPTAEPPVLTVDERIGEKIRDLFAGKFERVIDRRYKPAIEAFYSARGYAPLWIADGAENDRAKAVTAYLAGVDADGLDPSDYPAPSFASSDLATLAEAELRFSATVLTYARHAQLGRVHYSRVSADIFYEQVPPEPAAVLGTVATAEDVDKALESYNPPQPGYKALKAKLAEARGKDGGANAPRISGGAALKVGMSDPRVPALRERLGVAGEPGDLAYDKPLAEAVKKFQRQRDLPQTGVLNGATIDALNGQRHDRDADLIIANMERWRWIPRDLGNAYVVVNIPDFTLRVMDHGTQVWTTRIVTGQPGEKATPLLSETMKYITVNPTWNVPPSIINNEYLPAYQQDPTVLDRMGLKMEHNRDGTVRIYQPPGETNALGRLRFNFPNKFLVYQHDTPDKHLFALDKWAFSHGCMRVQYPDKYAEVLLNIANPKDGYTAEKIRKMYGSNERDIQLLTPIPVHLTYQTAFVDDAGRLETRADIYGRDSRLLAALKSEDRRIAEIPIEHKETSVQAKDIPVDRGSTIASNRRQAMRMPVQQQGPGQPSFFLFGLFR
jgi:murein L,D-transpeptidase YcbB/YkuD